MDASRLSFAQKRLWLLDLLRPPGSIYNLARVARLNGVLDIDALRRALNDLAERIFSPREPCELRSLPKPQQREAFFNGWTRKEAYLKATGEGLIDALPSIEVTLAPGKEPELLGLPTGPEAVPQWAIRVIPLPPDFTGAVVFEKNSTAGREFSG